MHIIINYYHYVIYYNDLKIIRTIFNIYYTFITR